MSEFEKFIAELDFHDIAHVYWIAWQAATAESDKRIAELNAENKQIDAINASLQAHINVLREAFEEIDMQLENGFVRCETCGDQEDTKDFDCRIWIADALSSTPAQSLQAHDDEVIEHCAQVCEYERYKGWVTGDVAEAIRALKENQFSYSANLDIYNSVIFADAPYGTMIMESKIVKWLCRNRAKDYFDEMVKGK